MQKTWSRLEQWLIANDPTRLADLRPPTQASLLTDLATKLVLALPDELAKILRWYDGQPSRIAQVRSRTGRHCGNRIGAAGRASAVLIPL